MMTLDDHHKHVAGAPACRLLVSVRDASEAESALQGGADVIDVKEPTEGSLGRASIDASVAVCRAVALRVPWTMACGELADGVDRIRDHIKATLAALSNADRAALPPPNALKVGLAGLADSDWHVSFERVFEGVPRSIARVAVIYADASRCRAPDATALVAAADRLGCSVVLLDTFDKGGAGVLELWGLQPLIAWRRAVTCRGLLSVLAGKIGLDDLSAARHVGADMIAVRSAVCSGGRSGTVDAELVRRARQLLAVDIAVAHPVPRQSSDHRS